MTRPRQLSPKTSEPVVSRAESNPARSGATFISDVRVQSNAVFMSTSGGYLDANVVLANPGRKATGLYLEGVVRQESLTGTTSQAPLRCTAVEIAMPRGTCIMAAELTVPYRDFTNRLGQFTLKLLQRNPDNTVTMVDSRTVDIVIVRI